VGSFSQGLTISLFGIGITFLALSTVILLIKFLLWIFPAKSTKDLFAGASSKEDENIAHVVAFAAAWWSQQQASSSSLGENLEKPRGRWWTITGD
jgi:Na+-transporting methylmalonyl-CoA/oxaloacetate decarboxylase gamma subunit